MAHTPPRFALLVVFALASGCGATALAPPAVPASAPPPRTPAGAEAAAASPPSAHAGLLYPYNLPRYHDLAEELAGTNGAAASASR